jgi:prepilin signal peptidase PulO-like enzyme (type II secretory pathway)
MTFSVYALLTSALLIVALIDLDHRIIPNIITLPGMAVGSA